MDVLENRGMFLENKVIFFKSLENRGYSALDKLLGQLGIYATWLS